MLDRACAPYGLCCFKINLQKLISNRLLTADR